MPNKNILFVIICIVFLLFNSCGKHGPDITEEDYKITEDITEKVEQIIDIMESCYDLDTDSYVLTEEELSLITDNLYEIIGENETLRQHIIDYLEFKERSDD